MNNKINITDNIVLLLHTKGEKMKKRKNIIISAITCLFSICLMMFGVYAASNPSVSISGQVSYSARDAKVLVLGKVNGQAGDDSNVDYPLVADATNPTESAVSLPAQYLGYTKGESANDPDDNLPQWNMGTTAHAFYEDSTGIRPIVISFKMTNLSNYPVVATVDFTGVTDANLASKNLTRTTTGLKDSKVYLDKNVTKEISVTYSVANDAVGVNGDGLLNMSITFEKTVFPTPSNVKSPQGETMQSDWEYSFDGESFTITKFVGTFPTKDADGNSTLVIPSQITCDDGKTYPVKALGKSATVNENDEMSMYDNMVIFDITYLLGDDDQLLADYMATLPTKVVISEGIEEIRPVSMAFISTESLPSTVKSIGMLAFVQGGPEALTVTSDMKLSKNAFDNSTLKTLDIDAEIIPTDAFHQCENLETVIMSDNVKTIEYQAFDGCSNLATVKMSKNITSIGSMAFYECNKLSSIDLPSGLLTIGSEAFGYSSLKSIDIPETVTSIGGGAFDTRGIQLENVYVNQSDVSKSICGTNIFGTVSSSSKLKIYVPVEDYKTATNWSTYKDYMIVGNAVISEETVSDWKVEICSGSTANIIGYVGDITKETVTVPSSVEFEGKTYKVVSVGDMKQYASDEYQSTAKPLYNDSYESIVGLILEEKISSLPSVKNIIIQEGIKNIGYAAFAGWLKIEQLVLPDSLQNISSCAFAFCGRLKTGSTLSVKIPDSITEIKLCAFGYTGITNLELSSNLKTIGEEGFYGAYISSLTLPDTLESIGKDAFNTCENLTELTIPKNIKSLGDTSFANCTALITVTFESITPPEYMNGNAPFHQCSKIADIFVPAESVEAYKAKFGESNLLTPLVKAK